MPTPKHPYAPWPGGVKADRVCRCSYCGYSFLISPEAAREGLAGLRCSQCGAPLGTDDISAPNSEAVEKRKRRNRTVTAAALAVLLLLAIFLPRLSGRSAEKRLSGDVLIESLEGYLTTDADGVKCYTVTGENFTEFYEADSGEYEVMTGESGTEIVPRLWLRYRLKPELAEIIEAENSSVKVLVEGSYMLTRIKSVDWETGTITLTEDSSTDLIVDIQDLFIANGYPSSAMKYDGAIKETVSGAAEIEIPLNLWSVGAWRIGKGIKGPISPLTQEDYADGYMWLPQLKEYRVTAAQGSLVLRNTVA